ECFRFAGELFPQVIDRLYVFPTVSVFLDGESPVMPFLPSFIKLFAFDHDDRTAKQNASWKRSLVHQHEYVDRIAILGKRRRNEPEVVRECHSAGQDFFQFENVLFRIESELVPASLRSLDHDAQQLLVVLVERLEPDGIAKLFFLLMSPPPCLMVDAK